MLTGQLDTRLLDNRQRRRSSCRPTMEKFLLCVVVLLATLSTLPPISASRADIEAGDLMDEQKMQGNCPEYCKCIRRPGDSAVIMCDRITPLQQFEDQASAFLVTSGGKSEDEQPIEMTEQFFVHLQLNSVDAITIAGVAISAIDVNAFKGLNSLSQVNMTDNDIQVLHPDTFASNKELRRLSLSRNPLSFTQKSQTPYLLDIPNLRELDLSSCQLYNLLPTTFSKLSELTYLNLEANNLNVIDPRTFSNMTSLEEINLSDNKIQNLHSDLFRFNTDLDVLKLRNNPIKTIDNMILPSITILDLSFCRFTKIASMKFASLKNINLSSNALVDIDTDTFTSMARLAHVDLSNNNFVGQLDAGIFRNNSELATLSLRDNPKMQGLPVSGLQGDLSDLYKLDASNCGLESVPPSAFNNMSILAHLDLSHNSISRIETGTLPRRLKHLSLAYNKITSLGSIQFPAEFQLRQLFMEGNQIKQLTPEDFINLPYLSKLQLQSCGMEQVWSNLAQEMPYLKNLHTLNLSNNKLQKVNPKDLQVFSELNSLGIMSNPLLCTDDLTDLIAYLVKAHVDPIITEEVADISEKFEWDDMWGLTCKGTVRKQEATKMPTDSKGDIKSLPESTTSDYFYDDDEEDYEEHSHENINNNTDDFTPFDQVTPKKLNISVSSYQMIVMTVVAIATFLLVISLVILWKVCRQRLMRPRSITRQIRRNYGPIYKPLYENEIVNTPTTPIMKTRLPVDLESSSNGHNEEMDTVAYSQTVGRITYLNRPIKYGDADNGAQPM